MASLNYKQYRRTAPLTIATTFAMCSNTARLNELKEHNVTAVIEYLTVH